MRKISLILIFIITFCAACTVSEIITAEKTELNVASLNIPESLLLDIGILNFDLGVSENNDPEKTGIYEEVREAESRYLPYHLKTTLQSTGYWGAVRVIPSSDVFTDIYINGVILRSDGEYINLKIDVKDVTGQKWFENTYSTQTGTRSYSENRDRTQDPYQKVFNDFSNDLRLYITNLSKKDIQTIRQTSELLFFSDMVPSVFSDYLNRNENGAISILRLPAENDPMIARLRQIRERDRLVVDMLNEHFANFYYGIALPYEGWRKKARENTISIRETKRASAVRALLGVAVTAGSMNIDTNDTSRSRRNIKRATQHVGIDRGIRTIIEAWQIRQSANIYRAEIGELTESFIAEAAPLSVRVEGQTRRLTGTAEAQYEGWRKLLKDIYQLETGFPEDVDLGLPSRSTNNDST